MLSPRALRLRYGRLPAAIRGAVLMLVASALFAGNGAAIRVISTEIHAFEIAFLRNAFGLVAMSPYMIAAGPRALRIGRLRLHALRSLTNLLSMVAYFYAVGGMALADVTAIGFATPLFASLGAVLVMGEVMRLRRWSALMVGFLGVLVVLRPGLVEIDAYAVAALAAAVSQALVILIIKHLVRIDDPRAVVVVNLLLGTPMALVLALFVWRWPSPLVLGLTAMHGVFGTYGQLCVTRALSIADASLMTPIDFARLPFIAILAWLLFGERSDLFTWLGGAIIFASTVYITRRESALKGRPPPPEIATPP
jgi:drug/metabolite transporter (DMT)-like permease